MSSAAASLVDREPNFATCFSVRAAADPGLLPRLVELFAKRGLVPTVFRSMTGLAPTGGDAATELTIDIHMSGLERALADYIAACMRQIVGVEVVLSSELPHG